MTSTSIERITAFSDGVFAIAITLLILDVTIPHVEHNLWSALVKQWPVYLSYVMSFVIIGTIWAQHHGMFRHIRYTNHLFLLINVVFLMWVAAIPFPTALLAEYLTKGYTEERTAMAVYSGMFVAGAVLFNLLWRYAIQNRRLTGDDADPEALDKITRSYNVGPLLYIVDFLLSFVSPVAGLVLFLLIALFYIVAPIYGEIVVGRKSAA